MTHSECVEKLKQIGFHLGFEPPGRSYGKMYHMGNPDCGWYYKGTGQEAFRKIAKGDRYKYLPLAAFEVAHSEREKNLRGTLVTLQLTNAAASIIILLGKSVEYKSYLMKRVGRYSFVRYRLWTEKDVNDLYNMAFKSGAGKSSEQQHPGDVVNHAETDA
jgi:hypothetical protein